VADINGDGAQDVIYGSWDASWSGLNWYFALSNGSTLASATHFGWYPYNRVPALGDYNGDGKADVLVGTSVRLFSGSGFAAGQQWGAGTSSANSVVAGDINGDGWDDIVYANYNGATTYHHYFQLSNGLQFSAPVYVGGFGSWATALADVDGDGLADLVLSNGQILTSNGAGFAASSWATAYGASSGTTVTPSFGDVNGDGLTDVFYTVNTVDMSFPPKPIYLQYSKGNGFEPPLYLGSISAWEADNAVLLDLNSDKRADLFIGYAGIKRMAVSATPDVVSSVTDSLGAVTVHTYKPITDPSVYLKDSDAVWPVRDISREGPIYVTAGTSISDGIGGTQTVNFFYRGAKAHLKGGGFLGFRQVESTSVGTGIKTTSSFKQDYPFHGLPVTVTQTQPGGAVLRQVSNVWNEAQYPNATGQHHRVELTQSVDTGTDLNGALPPTVSTTAAFDGFGNATQVTLSTGDGYSKTTSNIFINDVPNWMLGRLKSSTVQSTVP
jgi:hypothetical protein